jgi:prepilin-type N-terminal cleavage/methylation domain-containing protein
MFRQIRGRRADREDSGFTLIELMVSITLLAILMSLVTAAVLGMFTTVRKQQSSADAIDADRTVLLRLDRQLRFANAITSPGAGATAGTTYVEWQTGNANQPKTCTQWRYAAGAFQARTWTQGLVGSSLTSWSTQIVGVSAIPGQKIFDIADTSEAGAGYSPQRQHLTIMFQTTAGTQQRSTRATELTITAENSPSASVLAGACTDGSRP